MIHSCPNLALYPHHLRVGPVPHPPSTLLAAAHHHRHPINPSGSSSSSPPSQNYAIPTISVARRQNASRRVVFCVNYYSSPIVELQSSQVVRKFYDAVNRRDLAPIEDLIAPNCVYEDLIFPRPFVGRQAILEFLKHFMDSVGTDLQFAIDEISEDDSSGIGVTWHLEWKGKPFPFSKGCSFYRLEVVNGQKQIVFGRDSVEPAIKPGETALVAIRGITWLLQKFPLLADRL